MGHELDRLENILRAFVEMRKKKRKKEWYSTNIKRFEVETLYIYTSNELP